MQHNLTIADADRLAEWFLYRMPMAQRMELMADMPLVYARVFPSVSHSRIISVVAETLREMQSWGTTAEHETHAYPDPSCRTCADMADMP